MKQLAVSLAVVATLVFGMTGCGPTDAQGAIKQHFGDALSAKAIRVADCESGLNPKAVSPGGGNHGLFQINTVNKAGFEKLGYKWDPNIYESSPNARFAKVMYDDSLRRTGNGWKPWGACGTR